MQVNEFHYDLPEELIAQTPLSVRSQSRLLVLDRQTGGVNHRHFTDLLDYLQAGDCLVLNNSRVIPARLIGQRQGNQSAIELLLLTRKTDKSWECLVRPGKKLRQGAQVTFGEGLLTGQITEVLADGNRVVEFDYDGIFEELLDRLGTMPLPPYIHQKLADKERYQTVYSKHEGSSAAPTAGLHFTEDLLAKIKEKGVKLAYVTLHVGLGTFRPVKVDDVLNHRMHAEYCWIDQSQADIINQTKAKGHKVYAVGTTSCRTLESLSDSEGYLTASKRWTDIFIYPGYTFKVMDGMITNFHLPESTLLMLISAFADKEKVFGAYNQAIAERYRFYSFGDAMLIK